MELLEPEVGAWDCVLLEPLTEAAFISNLLQRFKRDHIYTYIGNELVSVNPYKKLALYSVDLVKAYENRGPYQLAPHLYGIAGCAYRFLRDRGQDQCIVCCGEAGAGKTEAARIVLQFIMVSTSQAASLRDMKERLVQAGTLLEAFGNAKTSRNDNSSRFGKYMDIEFDYKGDPLGATITNFRRVLQSRVTGQSTGERNFHVFYQLLTGADIQLLKLLKLQRNLDNYAFLGSSRSRATDNIDDKSDFQVTKKALETLGFTQEDIVSVMKIVASVLKLGNIGFTPANNIDGTEGCTIINDYELYEVCDLLSCEQGALQGALTSHSLTESATGDLSASEATVARDSLAKALYSRLFTWLINKINDFNKVKRHGKRKVLGILDVYGFEMFEHNGFDQFLINFCNEKLHQVIVDCTLKQEQEEYVKEGLEWTPIPFFNNSLICDLIEKTGHGMLPLLEGAKSDDAFLARLAQGCAAHAHCELRSTPHNNCFRLKHYAGTVTYCVTGFVAKNNDLLSRNMSRVMHCCDHPMMKTLFPEGNPKRTNQKQPATTGTQFKISLGSLVRNLVTKEVHYVRCIKPNELKQPRILETALVQHQVRYLGLLETVRIRRSGFCFRMQYQPFLSRYKMLSLHTWPHSRSQPVESVAYLVRDLPIPGAEFAFGRTKLFVRSPRTVFELEEFRRNRLHDLAVLLQKVWRGFSQRKVYLRQRQSQIIIASAWRSWRECRYGITFKGRRHLWCLYRVAREEYRVLKRQKQVEWAVRIIQSHYVRWKRWQFLLRLASQLPDEALSPISRDWPPCHRRLADTSLLLKRIYHKWRCHKYRVGFDQTSRNRLREKVTASIIFKERKASYPRSVSHPFLGDYVRLRQNVQWKKTCVETNDQYVVFADIINKITRSSGKFVPILFVLSTSSMLILDQRTLQVKYRVPAAEIYRLSLSPYLDDVAVFHVRAPSPVADAKDNIPGCLFQSDLGKKKGDFVFQTGHVIEIVTKLFLVVQNAVGKPPEVNITTEFEANFGQQTVLFAFKCTGLPEVAPGQIRILRKGNKMEVLV